MTDSRKITLEFPSLRAFLGEYGARISAEGMLLEADPPPAAGSEVDIEVVLAGGLPLLRARGETLWRGWTGAGGQEYGAAIRFRELDDASRTLIGKVVEQRRRQGEPAFELSEQPRPRGSRLRDLTVPATEAFGEPPAPAPSTSDAVFDLGTAPSAAEVPRPPEPPPVIEMDGEPPAPVEEEPEPIFLERETPELESLEAGLEGLELGLPEPEEPEPMAFEPVEPEPVEPEPGAPEPELATADPVESEAPWPEESPPSLPEIEELELDEPEPDAAGGAVAVPEAEGPSSGAPIEPPPALTRAGEADALFADIPPAASVAAPGMPPLEPEPSAAAPALDSEPATAGALPEASAAGGDLSELFGGDEPQSAPRGGLTDPFPPSFVDEVEAELQAADPAESSFAVLDTSRSEISPADRPEPTPPLAAAEPEVEIPLPAAPPAPPQSPEAELPDPEPPEPELPEPEPQPPLTEPAPEPPPPEMVAGVPALPELPELEEPGPPAPAIPERALEPPAMPPLDVEAPSPSPMVEVPAPATPAAAAEPGPRATMQDLGKDSLIGVEMGAETVELPLPKAARRSPPPAAAATPPTAGESVLAVPTLGDSATRAPAAQSAPSAPSAAALRGAAGRSRHLGTWLLIGLLAAGLAVAGYFAFGLLRGGGAEDRAGAPPPARPPLAAADIAGEPAITAAEEPGPELSAVPALPPGARGVPPPEEVAAAEATAPPLSEAAAPPPATLAPWGGLDRITWSERDGETLVTLVADGAIAPEQLETERLTSGDPRLVVKLSGAERPFRPAVLEVGTGQVLRIRSGLHPGGRLHVVVDLADPAIEVRSIEPRGSRLELRLGPKGE